MAGVSNSLCQILRVDIVAPNEMRNLELGLKKPELRPNRLRALPSPTVGPGRVLRSPNQKLPRIRFREKQIDAFSCFLLGENSYKNLATAVGSFLFLNVF